MKITILIKLKIVTVDKVSYFSSIIRHTRDIIGHRCPICDIPWKGENGPVPGFVKRVHSASLSIACEEVVAFPSLSLYMHPL